MGIKNKEFMNISSDEIFNIIVLLIDTFFKINSSLKFEIMAKQLYVASQRVL